MESRKSLLVVPAAFAVSAFAAGSAGANNVSVTNVSNGVNVSESSKAGTGEFEISGHSCYWTVRWVNGRPRRVKICRRHSNAVLSVRG